MGLAIFAPPSVAITATSLAAAAGGTTRAVGDFNVGNRFAFSRTRILSGAAFYFKVASEGTPETARVEFWDANGTLVDAATKSISSSGSQSILFPSTHTVAAQTLFTLSIYTAGTVYQKFTLASLPSGLRALAFAQAYTNPPGALYLGGGVIYIDGVFSATDAYPSTRNDPGTQFFAIDPV